jgi:uncharacterized membrane protein
MNFAPLWTQAFPIPPHAIMALIAVVVGGVQLALLKGTTLHRVIGYFWVGLMAFVAASSFFIHSIRMIGPFSPIHLLSILALVTLWIAIRAARAGNISRHRKAMVSLYTLGLILTGAFTLLPGRAMHAVVLGG